MWTAAERVVSWFWDKILGNFLWWIFLGVVSFVYSRLRPYLANGWQNALGLFRGNVATKPRHEKSSRWEAVGNWGLVFSIVLLAIWSQNLDSKNRRLQTNMERFVLPRHLSQDQSKAISDFLSKYPANQVSVYTVTYDTEAQDFSQELIRAIRKGGWAVDSPGPVPLTCPHLSCTRSYDSLCLRVCG